ncbi:endomucin isoform X2 [Mastomys coucha]|uniref:endomucin isoform X2 n=1 Tax=Mastomys coucha TaxID=35658 RepID=UPI001261C8AF|nr:endomucin isoform X2 [Mastomys coucha]
MQLLQVTALCFLLSNSLCSGKDSTGIQNNSTPSPIEKITTKASATTPGTVSVTSLNKSTDETTPEGVTNNEVAKTLLVPALTSITTPKHEVKMTTDGPQKNEVSSIKTTVPNTPTSNAVSTLPSSQNKTENQSSTRTTEISVTTQLPDDSPKDLPKTTETPSASLTTAKTISQLRDAEDGKVTATPSTTPSYSSIILPVVIALIVITVLVFTLVGLYRICWKRDPGTPENGNDQPPSDKESVKLLTVKTISHEPGFSFSF